MAGVKGMKWGLGRKAEREKQAISMDMLAFLQGVALGEIDATDLQVRAAIAAVQYTHTKRGDGGKKEEAEAKAKKSAAGRFALREAPDLKVVGA